jgi:nitroreductase
MYDLMGISKDDHAARNEAMMRNFSFFGAPVGMIITCDRVTDKNGWGHVGMFLQNICLVSHEFGLSTCLQEAWSTYHDVIYDCLKIDRHSQVIWCGIGIGYADMSQPVNTLRSSRLSVDEFATFQGFDHQFDATNEVMDDKGKTTNQNQNSNQNSQKHQNKSKL